MCWDLDPIVEVAEDNRAMSWVHDLPMCNPSPPTMVIVRLGSHPDHFDMLWSSWPSACPSGSIEGADRSLVVPRLRKEKKWF